MRSAAIAPFSTRYGTANSPATDAQDYLFGADYAAINLFGKERLFGFFYFGSRYGLAGANLSTELQSLHLGRA